MDKIASKEVVSTTRWGVFGYFFVFLFCIFSLSCSLFSSKHVPPFSDGRVGPKDASSRFVHTSPAAKHVGLLVWPVRLAKVSSHYGMRKGRFHGGVDIYKPLGTPVLAAHTGKIVFSADTGTDYGLMVLVEGDGIITAYAHNDENLVEVGDKVFQGDQIATVGESGNATGPHVHFEARVRNVNKRIVTVDPEVFFPK